MIPAAVPARERTMASARKLDPDVGAGCGQVPAHRRRARSTGLRDKAAVIFASRTENPRVCGKPDLPATTAGQSGAAPR